MQENRDYSISYIHGEDIKEQTDLSNSAQRSQASHV